MVNWIETSIDTAQWSVGLGLQHDHTLKLKNLPGQIQESVRWDWDIDTSHTATLPGRIGTSTRAIFRGQRHTKLNNHLSSLQILLWIQISMLLNTHLGNSELLP